ncbi:hypothetical protein BB561_002164 [Smittium simulii]|uniref:Uncharacterized protein n=1 Tax=Smittium simulii TaxID=133385 RepID=A0A2T9YRI5_9FUNG|nr:hypothetical protein BB561_002164 [Smittium simulii]
MNEYLVANLDLSPEHISLCTLKSIIVPYGKKILFILSTISEMQRFFALEIEIIGSPLPALLSGVLATASCCIDAYISHINDIIYSMAALISLVNWLHQHPIFLMEPPRIFF